MTRVDLTAEQCAALAEYLRGVLNNGMGAGCFGRIELLVLAYRALQAAEELPEGPCAPPVPPLKRRGGLAVMRQGRPPRRPRRRRS